MATRQGCNCTDDRLTIGQLQHPESPSRVGRESGGFAQNYFDAKRDSDRDHSRSEQYTVGGKWFYSSDTGDVNAGVIARHSNQGAQSLGYMTDSGLAVGRFQSPARNANEHDSCDMRQLSGHLYFQIVSDLACSSIQVHRR